MATATDIMVGMGTAATPKAEGDDPLSAEELRRRLEIDSTMLVQEIYEIARRQMDEEKARQGRLDAKATSLFGAVGFSLTIAFTFGGLLASRSSGAILTFAKGGHPFVAFFYSGAVLFGVVAGVMALLALRINDDYRTIGESAVFDKNILRVATNETQEEVGLAAYRRFIAVQYWEIARSHSQIHITKARLIRRGQYSFGVFLFFLLLNCGAMCLGIIR